MLKVLLVDQLGNKTYEYDYAAAKHYSSDYAVTCYMSDDTPRNLETAGFDVAYGFHDVYSGNKVSKGIKYIRSLYELKRFIVANQFDIINFQWYDIPLYEKYFVRSLKKAYSPEPKIVMTVHGIIPKEKSRYVHYSLAAMYEEADAILLHSEPGLKFFNECFDVDCPKYMITSAFRDENEYKPIPKEEARKKLGIPIGKKVILSFGTIREDKSIDVLYKAFPKAYEKNNELFLLSAGTLNIKNKEEYKRLADTCRATGSAKIDFEYVSKDIEPLYYSAADILVLPYSYISQSGVAYCGLLYDLPMIASRIPRLDLMAREGINADVFEKGNIEELADRIVKLSIDSGKMIRYSAGSHRIREQEFSIKRRVEATERAYRELYRR